MVVTVLPDDLRELVASRYHISLGVATPIRGARQLREEIRRLTAIAGWDKLMRSKGAIDCGTAAS